MIQVSRKGFRDKNGNQVVLTDPTKADKVSDATAGNLASLDAEGNLKDSGLAAGDVITNIAVEDLSELDNIIGTGVYHVVVYNDSGITQTREAKILFVRGSLSRGVYRLTQYLFDRYSIMSRTKAGTSPEWNEWEETNIGNVLTEPDDTPTEDSNKLVTSGGVKAELNKISALIRSVGNTDSIWQTIIKIDGAVSEGTKTGAVDNNTHAEGVYTVAAGRASHAEGDGGGDEVDIDVTHLWVVRNPIDDQGEIDGHSLYVSCGVGYVVDQLVSVGDVIMYRGVEVNGSYQYAKVQEISAVAGEENLFALQLSSPIQVNVTSDSRSKTLYKIPSGALGRASHVEGLGTVAKADYQHVQGKYNVADANGDYAYIIGNGTADDERSNAFAVKWDGTIVVWNNGTPVELSPATLDAFAGDGKANYYAGQLTIRNEGQSGFPVNGDQGVETDLDDFIASTTAEARYHAMVTVYKDSSVAYFPCLISWTESNNTKTVIILVSHYTFTASRNDSQGGLWDQEFTVVNNSSFFEVL